MSPSVEIKTPIPSPEDVASDLGITGKRLNGLLELVDGSGKKKKKNKKKKRQP